MIQYVFQIKTLSKDTLSFQRLDRLKNERHNEGEIRSYMSSYNQVWWMWTRWTMIYKMNEMDFLSIWAFFHKHSRITGLKGKGEGISLTPHYHFHPLHRHLGISRAVAAESSPLHIASSRTRTGNLRFPSASH